MTNGIGRRLTGLLLAVLLTAASAVTAFASTTNIGTDASRPEYFEALGGSGNYNPLKTPYHYDKTTGDVAYCIEHEKDSPSSSTDYELFDASTIYSQTTITGIQAILDNGYPANDGGLSEEQAHYATANAIRTWMKESEDIGYNFMIPEDEHIHPISGTEAQATWDFFLQLVSCARTGAVAASTRVGGTVQFYPRNPEWTIQGDTLYTQIEVQSSNGYTLARSSSLVEIEGYTGGTYDVLDITAPASLLGQTVQLQFTALGGSSSGVRMDWYRPTSASSQNVVVARVGSGSGGGTGEQRVVTITGPTITLVDLTVIKKDGSTDEPLDGAVFSLTDASGNPVGLTQTSAGRYTAGGSTTQFTTNNGAAVITGLNTGTYTLTEVSPPTAGYAQMEPEVLQLTANATVTVTNVPTEVTITKVDDRTNAPLAWMEFRLLDGDGNPVLLEQDAQDNYRPSADGYSWMYTDENRGIRIIGLPQGIYSIEESYHNGYAALAESPQFTLTAYADITITNEPLTVQIVKIDGGTGESMSGIEFRICDEYGNEAFFLPLGDGEYEFDYINGPRALVNKATNILTTDEDGSIRIYNIHSGSYMLEEITDLTAQGYTPKDPVSFTVTDANGLSDPVVIKMVNDPTVLLLTKSDSATREPLDGATFRIKDADMVLWFC